jgi:hypothetical protein
VSPLYPNKRTSTDAARMSALCQKRTFALQQICYSITPSAAHSPTSRRTRRMTRRCTLRSISSAASRRKLGPTRRTPKRRSRTRVALSKGPHQVCGARTAQNRSTAPATALATVALRVGDESTCSSARLTIIPASRSTAGIRDSYNTAILLSAS